MSFIFSKQCLPIIVVRLLFLSLGLTLIRLEGLDCSSHTVHGMSFHRRTLSTSPLQLSPLSFASDEASVGEVHSFDAGDTAATSSRWACHQHQGGADVAALAWSLQRALCMGPSVSGSIVSSPLF
jgi:hypothetical protein